MAIPAWRAAMRKYVDSYGIDTPRAWWGHDTETVPAAGGDTEESAIENFLALEASELLGAVRHFLGAARSTRTQSNLRNPGLKLLAFCASRRFSLPPTGSEAGLYFAKVALERDNIGAGLSLRPKTHSRCSARSTTCPRPRTTRCE